MIDSKINFQFDSMCDAGLKGFSDNQYTSEDIKLIEGWRDKIIEIK